MNKNGEFCEMGAEIRTQIFTLIFGGVKKRRLSQYFRLAAQKAKVVFLLKSPDFDRIQLKMHHILPFVTSTGK
jgi:hypothetical protein